MSGLAQNEIAKRGWALTPEAAIAMLGRPGVAFIDLRETSERQRHGEIKGAIHAPYPALQENHRARRLAQCAGGKPRSLVFFCAFGERSAMAVQAAQDAGLAVQPTSTAASTRGNGRADGL